MFVRIDKDLVVNMNNITSYIIIDDGDSYKLVMFKNDKTPFHTVFYMKDDANQMEILVSFVNVMKDVIANPENMLKYSVRYTGNDEGGEVNEEENTSR